MRVRLRTTVAVLAAASLALVVGAGTVGAKDKNRGIPARITANQAAMYTDEISDYGVCRGVRPECYNDWGNGWTEGETKRILIYSGTAGPRHAHLGPQLGTGLNPAAFGPANTAQWALKAWAAEAGIAADVTEDLSSARLNNYQAVVNLSGNRDTFDDAEQTQLLQFVRGGGGFVGIHNAFGAEYHWKWYEGLLGGANFYDHGPNRDGTVETMTVDTSTAGLPDNWGFKDEWYNLVPYPSFVKVLLEVDAVTSLSKTSGHPGHGEEHAVSWCHYYDGGRSWLTTLGHDVTAWNDTRLQGDDLFKKHVVSGLESAMGIKPFCS